LGRIVTVALLSFPLFALKPSALEEPVLLPQYGLNAEPRTFNGSEIDLVPCLMLWLSSFGSICRSSFLITDEDAAVLETLSVLDVVDKSCGRGRFK
jgi:hypothetical protein